MTGSIEKANELAQKYNCIVMPINCLELDIQDINNMYYEELFRAGKEIIVPAKNKNYYDFYTIEKGDSLYAVARKYNATRPGIPGINEFAVFILIIPSIAAMIVKIRLPCLSIPLPLNFLHKYPCRTIVTTKGPTKYK